MVRSRRVNTTRCRARATARTAAASASVTRVSKPVGDFLVVADAVAVVARGRTLAVPVAPLWFFI